MKRIIFLTIMLCFGQHIYSQNFKYEFELESVNNPGDAKYAIVEIRELLGVRIMKFHDDIDQFEIITHLEWEVEEMQFDLESIGFSVVGIIGKTNLE